MSLPDPKYECVMNRPAGPAVAYNSVHILKQRHGERGIEIKANWRWWGIGLSWGDTLNHRLDDKKHEVCIVWFIACHFGPLFFSYDWPKQAEK